MALLPFLRLHYHLFFFSVRTEQNCLPFVSSIPCWLVNDVPITAICQEAESRVRTYFEHDESVRGPVILDETNVWTVINAFICQKPCYFMRHYVAMYLGILRENNCAVLTTSLSLSLEAAAEPQTFPKQNWPRLLWHQVTFHHGVLHDRFVNSTRFWQFTPGSMIKCQFEPTSLNFAGVQADLFRLSLIWNFWPKILTLLHYETNFIVSRKECKGIMNFAS